jgi:hypothetical protein
MYQAHPIVIKTIDPQMLGVPTKATSIQRVLPKRNENQRSGSDVMETFQNASVRKNKSGHHEWAVFWGGSGWQ